VSNVFEDIQRLYTEIARRADSHGVSALSVPERNVLLAWWAKGEIDNGGFALLHSAPVNIEDVAQAFEAIGMNSIADACRQTILAFGDQYPVAVETRATVVDAINSPASGKDPWRDADRLVWSIGSSFEQKVSDYISRHRELISGALGSGGEKSIRQLDD
jgi:hypothetical protein